MKRTQVIVQINVSEKKNWDKYNDRGPEDVEAAKDVRNRGFTT